MDLKNKNYKILLTGGGTGGSVAPLLAVAEELKIPLAPSRGQAPFDKGGEINFEFLWLGTKFGPEREMVERVEIKFKAIYGGKLRRYFSFKNLADIIKIKLGFFQALFIMLKWRPDLVMSAGSFISVPIVWAAWILGVPVLIHQQDICAGLANKLMAPFAKTITVAFEKSLADYGKKAVWIGNPTRQSLKTPNPKSQFPIDANLPVVLIVGGGTGAMPINKLVADSLGELTKFCQIIHVAGKNKKINVIPEPKAIESRGLSTGQQDSTGYYASSGMINYNAYEFLNVEKMAEALNAADLVITRAGLGFLSELSYLGKPSIIIPMPDSHQEANAEFFKNKKAALVIEQKHLAAANFSHLVKDLLSDKKMLGRLRTNMKNAMKPEANRAMVKIVKSLLK